MGTTTNQQHHDQTGLGGAHETNGSYNNDWIGQSSSIPPENYLYADPAVINPEELATFPKQVSNEGHHVHLHHHHESHLVNKRTPVRDGRNITRTDNHPDRNGFM